MNVAEQTASPPTTDLVIEASGLHKEFDGVVALDSVDLAIENGAVVGIIGPSGSGKTTAIRLLLGLYRATAGTVTVFGRDPVTFSRLDKEEIGYLAQDFRFYPDLTVRENLLFAASIYGLGVRRRRRRADDLLELTRLTDAKDRLASRISGGMQRRLALACALVHEPKLIVLDEPTAGLDPVLRAATWDIFRELQNDGSSLVITTQYVSEAEYCDYVYLISEGVVASSGTPMELRRQAFGGDVVRVTILDLDRDLISRILEDPQVRHGIRLSDDELQLVVANAGEAIPILTREIAELGYQVVSIQHHETTFDRIFVELVEQAEGNNERNHHAVY